MKKKVLSVFVSVAVVLFGCNINNVFAADGVEANILTGCAAAANNDDGAGIWCLLSTGLSILTYVVGVLAVLGVMIAGVQYIMSQGEPQKMAKAKNRILQVVIGLLIYAVMWSALRFLVPGFSLEKLNEYNGGSSSNSGGGNAPSSYVSTETQYASDEIKSNFDGDSNSLGYDLNGSSKTYEEY